jgi:voltage-gated potassium channel
MGHLLKKAKNLFAGYYNLLLLFLTALFVFRPYARSDLYLAGWKLLLTATLLTAIFNSKHSRAVRWVSSILAVPTVILCWLNLEHNMGPIFVANSACTILFLTIVTGSVLYDVVLRARVTLETLRGVICAYFMIAFVFAYVYYLIEFITPGTFRLATEGLSVFSYAQYISEMLYFSFVTLLTIGYGDIIALKDVGQTAAVLEGIIGQFYVAILVARLVSVYTFYGDKQLLKEFEHKQEKERT